MSAGQSHWKSEVSKSLLKVVFNQILNECNDYFILNKHK